MCKFRKLGAILAAIRKEKGINQHEMAAMLTERGYPVSNQAICKWENGTTVPNAPQFLEMCDILQIEDVMSTFSNGQTGFLRGLNLLGQKRVHEYIQALSETKRFSSASDEDQ